MDTPIKEGLFISKEKYSPEKQAKSIARLGTRNAGEYFLFTGEYL